MILIVDNYDSFVYMIASYLTELGAQVRIRRNDRIADQDLNCKAIVLSPGPCAPAQAGQSIDIIRKFSGSLPILGICLGHQAIGVAFGAEVRRAQEPLHGEASKINHNGAGIFLNIASPFLAGRYHSLIVHLVGNESPLQITGWSDKGEIMALQHREHPTFGVQFHPESVQTQHGYDLLRNFLKLTC